jgi:hypothetical protein
MDEIAHKWKVEHPWNQCIPIESFLQEQVIYIAEMKDLI